MCDFKPGDEVVCVNASWTTHGRDAATVFPVRGVAYMVAEVLEDDEGVWVVVAEIPDHAYAPEHFRKVQRRKTDLSIESFLTIKPGFEEPRRPKAPAKKERVS